ncbi:unnamed protein product [Bursaphelenchus okinawaensis]|uniref:Uncharacterized protein n=1 Tax=Bursaphelenchus okinawaensis TaxID=465554 RepID=A0A811KFM0_9BILA|nr:unnamed protein product [Bursaphelenchus okinawaensis]CAG9102110.1 unnamed protein product [Bursaphelenchus okinawaensis]
MKLLFVFITFLTLLISAEGFGFFQSVGAKGRVLCQGKPVDNEIVSLIEKDWFYNDELEQTTTNDNGEFELWGMDKEVSEIDVYLQIISECPFKSRCRRKFKSKIPKEYITWHRKPPGELYNVPAIELSDWPLETFCNVNETL